MTSRYQTQFQRQGRPHASLWQLHSGVKALAQATPVRKRINGANREFRVGTWCPICGLEPNEHGSRLQKHVLQKILRHKLRRPKS